MNLPCHAVLRSTLFFIVSLALFMLGMDKTINIYDEGLILTGALRVMAGEIQHRDFYANYGPGQFYLLAGLFKLFDPSVLVLRIYDSVLRAGILLLVWRMATHYVRPWIAVLTTACTFIWLLVVGGYGYPVIPVLLLALAALYVLLRSGTSRAIFAAGALTGLAALFRYDAGGFIAVALSVSLLAMGLMNKQSARSILRQLVIYAAGIAIVFVPVAGVYLAIAPLSAFLHDVIIFPGKFYNATRALPFPGLVDALGSPGKLVVFLPLMTIGAALATWRRQSSTWRLLLLPVCLLTGMLYLKGIVRVSPLHFIMGIVPSFLLIGMMLESALQQPRKNLRIAISVLAMLSVVISGAGMSKRIKHLQRMQAAMWQSRDCTLCFPTSPDREAAAAFVADQTAPGERIFVGLDKHDRTFINDNYFYFLAGRLPATHWHHFDPALQDRADIQQQMIAEFTAASPRLIVLESGILGDPEPNESANSSGVTLLDDYIASHYTPVRQFGPLTVLRPNND